jgi:hypothetical protein
MGTCKKDNETSSSKMSRLAELQLLSQIGLYFVGLVIQSVSHVRNHRHYWDGCYIIYLLCPQTSATYPWPQPAHSKITSTCLSLHSAVTHNCDEQKTHSIVCGSWLMRHSVQWISQLTARLNCNWASKSLQKRYRSYLWSSGLNTEGGGDTFFCDVLKHLQDCIALWINT